MGKQVRRDAQDVRTQTVVVKASDTEVKHTPLPSIRVQTSMNKTTSLTVTKCGDGHFVKRRYHEQNHPCPICYYGRGGTGLVKRTDGRIQYVYCRACGHGWTNPIPIEVPLNEPKDPLIESLSERFNAIELAWQSLKPEERQAVFDTISPSLDKITS